jgi:ParB family transcriptional regulator, chromosome partitioning protein
MKIEIITVGPRRRELDPAKVDALADSMRTIGQLQSIVVAPRTMRTSEGKRVEYGFRLVAGLHRIEAAKRLGWKDIRAIVARPKNKLHRELREIDENLIRADLSELERAEHLAARKDIYERLNPETRRGGDHGNQYTGGKKRDPSLATPSFVDDTAAKTGMAPTVIRDAVRVANAIDPEVRDEIRGVREIADKKVELEALSRMPEPQQKEAVARVKSGAAKSVREGGVARPEALAVAAGIIARSVPDLAALVDLLEIAGLKRLAASLRGCVDGRPAEIGGEARPDPAVWRRGQL